MCDREYINSNPVARRPLEIVMGYLICQLVEMFSYICLADQLILIWATCCYFFWTQ